MIRQVDMQYDDQIHDNWICIQIYVGMRMMGVDVDDMSSNMWEQMVVEVGIMSRLCNMMVR